MKNWIKVANKTYDIPITLTPYKEYTIEIVTDTPATVTLSLNGYSVGTFENGAITFIADPEFNQLTLSTELDFQTITDVTLIETQPDDLMEAIQQPVKYRESQTMTYNGVEYSKEIKSSELNLNGRLNKTNMRELKLEIHGNLSLLGATINFKRGFTTLDRVTYEIDYGAYKVLECEYNDDTKVTDIIAYDLMIKTHVEYKREDINLTIPATLLDVFLAVANTVGLDTTVTEFPNSNQQITEDKWAGTNYTYRDVLDQIAEVAGQSIGIKDGKLDIWGLQETGITIDYKRSSKLKVGEKVGTFNILNLTREPQHDNYAFPTNWNEIPIENRSEYVIINNQIVDKNRAEFAPLIFDEISGLSYTTFTAETFGWGIFDVGDIVTVKDLDDREYMSVITSELNSSTGMWLTELKSERLDNAKDEYVLITDEKRQGMRTYLLVDQQNGIIEGLVTDVGDQSTQLAQLRITVDEIEQTVSNIDTTNNIIPNFNGYTGYRGWGWQGGNLKAVSGLLAYEGLRQSTNWIRRKVDSEAVYGLEFFSGGYTFSPKGLVTGGEEYSYNARVMHGTENYDITIREYTEFDGSPVETQTFTINVTLDRPSFTFTVGANTRYVDLKYNIPNTVTPTNTVLITEQIFNKGQPGEFSFSVAEFVNETESKITQLSDSVTTTVTKVETLDGVIDEYGTQIQQNADNITLKVSRNNIIGGINASAESVKILSDRLDFNNAYGTNVDLTGKITATSGAFPASLVTGKLTASQINFDNAYGTNVDLTGKITATSGAFPASLVTGKLTASQINFDNAYGTNVDLTGKITATSGKIGDFTITGSALVGDEVKLWGGQIEIGKVRIHALPHARDVLYFFDIDLLAIEGRLSVQKGAMFSDFLQVNGRLQTHDEVHIYDKLRMDFTSGRYYITRDSNGYLRAL